MSLQQRLKVTAYPVQLRVCKWKPGGTNIESRLNFILPSFSCTHVILPRVTSRGWRGELVIMVFWLSCLINQSSWYLFKQLLKQESLSRAGVADLQLFRDSKRIFLAPGAFIWQWADRKWFVREDEDIRLRSTGWGSHSWRRHRGLWATWSMPVPSLCPAESYVNCAFTYKSN